VIIVKLDEMPMVPGFLKPAHFKRKGDPVVVYAPAENPSLI
jgi:hypothetical protein